MTPADTRAYDAWRDVPLERYRAAQLAWMTAHLRGLPGFVDWVHVTPHDHASRPLGEGVILEPQRNTPRPAERGRRLKRYARLVLVCAAACGALLACRSEVATEADLRPPQFTIVASGDSIYYDGLFETAPNGLADRIALGSTGQRVCPEDAQPIPDRCGAVPGSELPPAPPPPPPPPGGTEGAIVLVAGAATRSSGTTLDVTAPTPGALMLLWVGNTATPSAAVPTIAGTIAWTQVGTMVAGGPRRITVFRAIAPADPFTVTIDTGAPGNVIWALDEYPGATTVVQQATGVYRTLELGGLVTLASSPAGSETVGGFFCGCADSPVAGDGFDLVSADNAGVSTTGSFWMMTEVTQAFDPTVDAQWASPAHWIAIGLAIQ